jgi:hypothetical protein
MHLKRYARILYVIAQSPIYVIDKFELNKYLLRRFIVFKRTRTPHPQALSSSYTRVTQQIFVQWNQSCIGNDTRISVSNLLSIIYLLLSNLKGTTFVFSRWVFNNI